MKTKILFFLIAFIVLLSPVKEVSGIEFGKKSAERKAMREMNRSINKEDKILTKDGFRPEPGAPSIKFQLRESMEKQYATDAEGKKMYLVGVGSAISGIKNSARMHAVSDAVINASTLLESKIFGLIENDYNNKLYGRNEYETLSNMKGVFSNLLAKKLPVGNPVCTFIKDNGKHFEIDVRIAYSMDFLAAEAMEVM